MRQEQNAFDICILCALPEEADAVEEAITRRYQVSFQQGFSQADKYEYHHTCISNKKGERLTLLLSWLPAKGLVETAVYMKSFLQEFRPRFAAMPGICAGEKTRVRLGDLIVAECAYIYDSGKVLPNKEAPERKEHIPEGRMYHPDQQTLQYARRFLNWEPTLARLVSSPAGLAPPQCHIMPLASGNAVRSDSPFQELTLLAYKTAAIDMEGAAFYRVASDFPYTKALVVKGVCDYADANKNDLYHNYAALISAMYVLCFIEEYVSNETMPGRPVDGSQVYAPLWNVPFLRNPLFTGREEVLSLLQERFINSISQAQALCGLGGIGKTQIAIEYIYRHLNRYEQIFWVNAATGHTLIADFASMARQLDLSIDAEEEHGLLIKRMKHWLLEHDQWLLILDNANTPELVYDFLPGRYKGHILLTTQAQALGPLAQSIEVQELDEKDARALLLWRAKISASEHEMMNLTLEDEAYNIRTIVTLLGGFPLALDQAGAYLEETGCSLAEYLTQLQQKAFALLQRRGATSREHPASLVATWSLSFEKIEQADPLAADLLRFCAFLAPDSIPQELLAADGAPFVSQPDPHPTSFFSYFDEAIALLRRFSMVRRHSHERTFSLHRLVQVVVKAQMDQPLQCFWAERVLQAVNAVFPAPGEPAWSQGHRYLPHVSVCMMHLHNYPLNSPEAPGLFSRAGRWLHEHAQYKEAETLYLCACRLEEQQGDADRPALVKTLDALARLNLDLGMYQQATSFSQRALALKKEVFGAEHPEVASTLYLLGRLSHAQVEYSQAQEFYQEALLLNKRGFGLESPETATTLHALAWLFHDQQFYAQAEDLYQQALSIRLQKINKNRVSVAVTLHQLAWLFQQQQRYREAEAFYRQALSMKEQALGPEHPSTAITLHYFARFYHDQKDYEQARVLYQRALAVREQMLGRDHPFSAETLHYLARLFHDQQYYEQAEELYQRALTIREQVYGPDHFTTAMTLHHFARLCQALRKDAQANHFYRRALAIRERSPGQNHPATRAVAQEYALFLHVRQQNSQEAL
jgi:tetratricopeptide (TPR) repeat protein/nucleoside phosphorylase